MSNDNGYRCLVQVSLKDGMQFSSTFECPLRALRHEELLRKHEFVMSVALAESFDGGKRWTNLSPDIIEVPYTVH